MAMLFIIFNNFSLSIISYNYSDLGVCKEVYIIKSFIHKMNRIEGIQMVAK
jgi:hypothetical protein